MNTIEQDAIKTDSNTSVMRIAFLYSVKITLLLTSVATVAAIVGPFIAYLIDKNLNYKIDLVGIASLLGTVTLASFGGKAIQSFSELPVTSVVTTSPVTNTQSTLPKAPSVLTDFSQQ